MQCNLDMQTKHATWQCKQAYKACDNHANDEYARCNVDVQACKQACDRLSMPQHTRLMDMQDMMQSKHAECKTCNNM
ncbi:hypothetical protein CsSME_00020314 [Camellia sinensis var. sinensis]